VAVVVDKPVNPKCDSVWSGVSWEIGTITSFYGRVCGGGTSKYDLAFLFYCIKRFVYVIL